MFRLAACASVLVVLALGPGVAAAQEPFMLLQSMPEEAEGQVPAANTIDLTQPEEQERREAVQNLLAHRPVEQPGIFNILAYAVQYAIGLGVPANTIVLVLLAPILAAIVAFTRIVLGLPTLEMLVPIALAFAFVALGIVAGFLILSAIVAASFLSRVLLRRVPIMHFAKRSLSLLILSFFVFGALILILNLNPDTVRNLSIFPILILMLLGDSIVSVQLYKSLRETVEITTATISLGLVGFFLATAEIVQSSLILYPELVLLVIPLNILIGRYFGLRLSEFFRFRSIRHGEQ